MVRPVRVGLGQGVGVKVVVDHIDQAQIPTRLAAEIQAGQGHDLVQYIAPLSQLEPSVLDLPDLTAEAPMGSASSRCDQVELEPQHRQVLRLRPGWVPDPGNFRRLCGTRHGRGPATWDDLLGAAATSSARNVQLGLGMSQEIDSNMVARALLWSFGAPSRTPRSGSCSTAGHRRRRRLHGPLFKDTMTDEVFAWNAASNNQGLVAGKLSYILNSISAWRTAQHHPEVADDILFVARAEGPEGPGWRAARHVQLDRP